MVKILNICNITCLFQDFSSLEARKPLQDKQKQVLFSTKSVRTPWDHGNTLKNIGIGLLEKAKSEANEDVDPFAINESVDSYNLKNGDGAMLGFFSSLASLATEQVGSYDIVLGDRALIKLPCKT